MDKLCSNCLFNNRVMCGSHCMFCVRSNDVGWAVTKRDMWSEDTRTDQERIADLELINRCFK
jgi:L-lysine 2,3-aminomutase